MTTTKQMTTAILCLLIVSSTPALAAFTDFSDISPGTTFTSPGQEFFSGSIYPGDNAGDIRFETALFSHPFYPPPDFNHVDIDISVNLGFGQDAVKTGNHLYPNNSSIILDFAGSTGTQNEAYILFAEGSGAINFDVNNTDPNTGARIKGPG